jgi:RNA polymerase sigma-70 factor, ECF subfamily
VSAEPDDLDLVHRFQSGDQEAFVALMQRHERRIYNLAYRMLGRAEDARDATQDVFLSCFRHLGSFRGDSAFSTWIHRIAVNASFDVLRKRTPTVSLDDWLEEPATAPDHAEGTAVRTDVQRALLEIPAEFRAPLVMHEVLDLPVEEIAEALDVPIGTVKSRLFRGRVALGRVLAGEPDEVSAPSKPATTTP